MKNLMCVICDHKTDYIYGGFSVCFRHFSALLVRDMQFDLEDVVNTMAKEHRS